MLLVGDRVQSIIQPLNMSGCGLEVAPYFNPIALKSKFDVLYTDYISTEEIRKKAATNPGASGAVEIPEVDYVWTPGKPLRTCISNGKVFDYAIASHVIEHVPNVIGLTKLGEPRVKAPPMTTNVLGVQSLDQAIRDRDHARAAFAECAAALVDRDHARATFEEYAAALVDRDHARAAFAECAAALDSVNRKRILSRIARSPLGAWLKQTRTDRS